MSGRPNKVYLDDDVGAPSGMSVGQGNGDVCRSSTPVAAARSPRGNVSNRGCEPSAECFAWCDCTILVTNGSASLLAPTQAAMLYRARWHVELLFRPRDLVAELIAFTVVRQMVCVWSRLLVAIVRLWLMVGTIWGAQIRSMDRVRQRGPYFVGRLAAALDRVRTDMRATSTKTCPRDERAKPDTASCLRPSDSWASN